jgi:DNA-binding transcriptional ArsR family regulator
MSRQTLELRAKLFRGLADHSRLRVLEALRGGPLSAGDAAIRAKLSQSNASMHLACLAECGLVRWERDGKFMHYEIADKRVLKLLDEAEDLLIQVGPLIEACRRYQRPERRMSRASRTERRRWRR